MVHRLVEDEEELDARLVEDGADEDLVGAQLRLLRRGHADVVEHEGHGLALVGDGIGEPRHLLHRYAVLRGDSFLPAVIVLELAVLVVLEVAEMQDALVAVAGVEPEVAPDRTAVHVEVPVEIILRRIDDDLFRQVVEDMRKDRHLVVEVELGIEPLDEFLIVGDGPGWLGGGFGQRCGGPDR